MKNLFTFDFPNQAIVASKTALKKAGIPGSPEYKALMKMMKQQPTFTVGEKVIKPADSKRTYKGMTQPLIEKYISIQNNSAVLEAQYEQALATGKFPLVRKWFLQAFPGITVEKAKREIAEAALAKIIDARADAESKVLAMPAAANQ